MKALLVEVTEMSNSLKLPRTYSLLQEAAVNEESEGLTDLKITSVIGEDENELLLQSKKEFNDGMLSVLQDDLHQYATSLNVESDCIPSTCLSQSMKHDIVHSIEHSLEYSSKEPGNVSNNVRNGEEANLLSFKQGPEFSNTNIQDVHEQSPVIYRNIQDVFSIGKDINTDDTGKISSVTAEEIQYPSEKQEAKIDNIENSGNDYPKSEDRTRLEQSSGYLSQWISNSTENGGVEGSMNVGENAQKSVHINQPLPSSGKEKRKSSRRKNISKIHEAERTQNHIQYLLEQLPELAKHFDLHKKIGVGTFSSVFLGSIKDYIVASRFPELKDKNFAIKHLVPTLHPKRIARELKYLHQIGGKDNVCGVNMCLRNGDCVVIIMPYLAHERFNDYVLDMDAEEARDYIRNLMIALRRVHSFNVIHRDVKPSNFLYNRDSKRYILVDFGLSQNMLPQAKWTVERARKRKRQEENCNENMKKTSQTSCKPANVDLKSRRMALQTRSREENLGQGCNNISQPVKRLKLNDPYARGQKMIDQLNQQKLISFENKRTPLTPKTPNQQNKLAKQNFKLPHSSSKIVDKDINIKKKLFPLNNENDLPKVSSTTTEGESSAKSNLSSPFAIRKASHQQTVTAKLSPGVPKLNAGTGGAASVGTVHLNEPSKQKFQTLVPKPIKDANGSGSTIVRVQNSQVKSQTLKPLSPLESEKQRKMLLSKQRNKRFTQSSKDLKCFCKGMPQVCNTCLTQRALPAPHAGTPGFRPPEVLLKYPLQTTAVDMWAAGVILLCILSGCYPFFRAPDDITGLAEIMTVFGTDNIKRVAKNLGRTVQCSNEKQPLDLRKLCERLRRRRKDRANGVPDTTNTLPICPKCENSIEVDFSGCLCLEPDAYSCTSGEFPPSAYDLLQQLLDLNPATRISAEEALQHPFLKEC